MKYVYSLIFLIAFTFAAIAIPTVSTRIESQEIYPGDLFSIQVELKSEFYERSKVSFPNQDGLRLISKEVHPVEYIKSVYYQNSIWIFQATRSGHFTIKNGKALTGFREQEILTIPEIKINVLPYSVIDTSDIPEALPKKNMADSPSGSGIWVVLVLISLPTIGLIVFICNKSFNAEELESKPSIAVLVLADLDHGIINTENLENFLSVHQKQLSKSLRIKIEKSIFGNVSDPQSIATEIRKEVYP